MTTIQFCRRCGLKREPDLVGPNTCERCGYSPLNFVRYEPGEEEAARLLMLGIVEGQGKDERA
jgi:hypothetical protein